MGTLSDIIDIVKGVRSDSQFITKYVRGPKRKSLSRSSLDGTLNFPILTTGLLSIDDASLIAKSLERNFSSFVLTTISMNPYFNTGTMSGSDYIKQLHQNIDIRNSGEFQSNLMDSITKLSEFTDYLEDNCIDYTITTEAYTDNVLISVEHFNAKYSPVNDSNRKYNYTIDEVTNGRILNRRRLSSITESDNRANKYIDNAYKKVNELVPTLLQVRVYPTSSTGTDLKPIDMVIGVKGTLHPIPSNEIMTNLARGLVNDDTFFNFIRWTTGELSFFKDFVFAISNIKMDASNDSNRVSPWWSMLKRRRALAKIKGNVLPNKILPNATIVITEEEVNILRDRFGYDLNNKDLIFKLMDSYYLIAFVIVDPALQRARFLFDGRYEFETYTYSTLKKELSGDDQKFKEMINLLGRRM